MKVRSRFSYFRDKFQVFVIGLLFGLVLGGGFFVLKLDQYVKELSFYKSLTQKDSKTDDLLPIDEEKDEKVKPKKEKKPAGSSDSQETTTADNSQTNDDTTSLPSLYTGNNSNGEIVVRKDEQMAEKTYSIINVNDTVPGNSNPAGSLAVEFWKSPLNYHGYKFNRNKLVLFGYGDQDLVSVFKVDNTTVLKCLTGVFRIEPTTEFHQLERITDENTLSKIQ